ncbi:MAG: hypothetical protein MSG64_15625 [Pyrinomonadaceae bacterium MAG19_C2-C3]|nr:hypothetical protein [Pyrinomonadaceae bacterium MAG19_C2-C3]
MSDTIVDAGGNPRRGVVTFILTQQAASSATGIVPKGAGVSATLDAQGRFTVDLLPSTNLSPESYYQVWLADAATRGRESLGVYAIPAQTTTVALAGRRVVDSVASRYTFAAAADVARIANDQSGATFQSLFQSQFEQGGQNGSLLKLSNGKFANSRISETNTATNVTGNLTASGTITAPYIVGNGQGITGLTGATGGVSNSGSTTIAADTNTDGVGKVSVQTAGVERLGVEANGTVNVTGALTVGGAPVAGSQTFSSDYFGLKGDGRELSNGSIVQGSTTITVSGATTADIGKTVIIAKGGGHVVPPPNQQGAVYEYDSAHRATITNVSGSSVTISSPAPASASTALVNIHTDNTANMEVMRAFLAANPGTTVMFRPGRYCYTQRNWLDGVKDARIVAKDVQFQNVSLANTLYQIFNLFLGGPYEDFQNIASLRKRIETVRTGSRTIKLQSPSDVQFFPAGTRLYIDGFPRDLSTVQPSSRYHEYNKVKSVSSDGTITLVTPLRYAYDDRWYLLPASVLPLDRKPNTIYPNNAEYHIIDRIELDGMEFVLNPFYTNIGELDSNAPSFVPASQVQITNALNVVFNRVSVDGLVFDYCDVVQVNDSSIGIQVEADKNSNYLEFNRSFINKIVGSTGWNNIVFNDSTIQNMPFFAPVSVHFNRCRIVGGVPAEGIQGKTPTAGNYLIDEIVFRDTKFLWTGVGDTKAIVGTAVPNSYFHLQVAEILSPTSVRITDNYNGTEDALYVAPGYIATNGDNRLEITNAYAQSGTGSIIVEGVFDKAPVVGEAFRGFKTKSITLENTGWENLSEREGYPRLGSPSSQEYRNTRAQDGEVILRDFHLGLASIEIPIGGYITRIEVVVDPAWTGTGRGLANIFGFAPEGAGFPEQTFRINLNYVGDRILTKAGNTGAKDGDYLPALYTADGRPRYKESLTFFIGAENGAAVISNKSQEPHGYIKIFYDKRR